MKNILSLLLILFSINVIAQENDSTFTQKQDSVQKKPTTFVRSLPYFPGCKDSLNSRNQRNCTNKKIANAISTNYVIPDSIYETDLRGNQYTYLQFVIKKDGSIGDIKVLDGCHPILDNAAIKALKNVPNLYPAVNHDGSPVEVMLKIPVSVFIDEKPNKKKKRYYIK